MATIALSVPIAQATPLRPNRRDLVATQGDDLTLAFTIYDNDTDTTPKDVTGGALRFRMFGNCADASDLDVAGTIITAAAGRMNVALTNADLADLAGEFWWQLRWSLSSAYTTICEGALLLKAEAPDA